MPYKTGIFLPFVLLYFLGAEALPVSVPAFRENTRVCFVGDSITHGGLYHNLIASFYTTRFPDKRIAFYNCGIGGWTLGSSLKTFEKNVAIHKPDTMVVMLGMNDVGRENYGVDKTNESWLNKRSISLKTYQELYATYLEQAAKSGVSQIILMTPSPYDQTAKLNSPPNSGVNDGLASMARFLKSFSAERNLPLVDWHQSLTDLNESVQKINPAFTLVGQDRIHPGTEGNLLMSYLFLKSQNLMSYVSKTVVDVSTTSISVENGEGSALQNSAQGLQFRLLEKALPWFLPEVSAQILNLVPLVEDFNLELLLIKNLPKGTYDLFIDDEKVWTGEGSDLVSGLNLSSNKNTPQYRSARKVMGLIQQKQNLEHQLQSLAFLSFHLTSRKLAFEPPEIYPQYFETGGPLEKEASIKRYYDRYLEFRADLPAIPQKIESLIDEIYQSAKPVKHRYRIAGVTP